MALKDAGNPSLCGTSTCLINTVQLWTNISPIYCKKYHFTKIGGVIEDESYDSTWTGIHKSWNSEHKEPPLSQFSTVLLQCLRMKPVIVFLLCFVGAQLRPFQNYQYYDYNNYDNYNYNDYYDNYNSDDPFKFGGSTGGLPSRVDLAKKTGILPSSSSSSGWPFAGASSFGPPSSSPALHQS